MNRRACLLLAAVATGLCLAMFGLFMPWYTAAPSSVHAQTPPSDPADTVRELEQFWADVYANPQTDAGAVGAAGHHPPLYMQTLLAKATPDECYHGIGEPYTGVAPLCADGGVSKVNQAYVWGLTAAGDDLWFGTAPNVHCLVMGAFLGIPMATETNSYVCEFGESQIAQWLPPEAAIIGDWRPPKFYYYDQAGKALHDVTPTPQQTSLVTGTLGIRSAATYNGYVFLAGPALGGINIFVFDAATHAFVDAANLSDYDNVRRWLVHDGVLYVAVGIEGGGAVLRYTGDPANPASRFDFVTVGNVDNDAAELVAHEGRLFVNTWPTGLTLETTPTVAALWMSPIVPDGGLTSADADNWRKVFSYDQYEPDPVTAAVYGGGAMASYGGYLYFGTMHVPFLSTIAHVMVNGTFPTSSEEAAALVLGAHRAVSIFRASSFDEITPTVDLLYGEAWLPVYDNVEEDWFLTPNNMGGQLPMFGVSGINNFFNNYTWSMAVYEDQLFIGTMDYSYLVAELLSGLSVALEVDRGLSFQMPDSIMGADLFRFISPDLPAIPDSIDGVGNFTNYGVRNMVSDEKGLYLGMANPMNLLTDPADDMPEGGWELIRIAPPALRVHKAGDGSGTVTSTPDGVDCGITCTAQYGYGEGVMLQATPAVGSEFSGWSGDCTGTDTCLLSMTANQDVTATFSISNHLLQVNVVGSGVVSSTPAGIDCGSTCDALFGLNETVRLTPVPADGYTFNGWSGACSGMGDCDVLMTEAKAVTATFVPVTYPVSVHIAGTGSGAVAGTPSDIDCSVGTCTGFFDHGTSVRLDAVASIGSSFDGWSGACTGTDTCEFTVTGSREVTATFTQNPQETLIHVEGELAAGEPLTFTASLGLGPVDSCEWDFGDGTSQTCDLPVSATSTDAVLDVTLTAVHVYTTSGTYTVSVTAANAAGSVAAVRTIAVGVPTGSDPGVQPVQNKVFLPLLERE